MLELPKYGAMAQSHTLLQPSRSCRVLNEGQTISTNPGKCSLIGRSFFVSDFLAPRANQLCLRVERDTSQHLVWKLFVNHHRLRSQVRGDSSQSGSILGRLDLEIRVGEER